MGNPHPLRQSGIFPYGSNAYSVRLTVCYAVLPVPGKRIICNRLPMLWHRDFLLQFRGKDPDLLFIFYPQIKNGGT